MTVIASTSDESVDPPLILSLSKNTVAIYGGGARRVAPKTPAWLTKQLLCKVSPTY
jgi:hypothetical protein